MTRLLSRRVPAWVLVLTVYLSAAVALAQIAPSPVHPSSSGSGVATSVSAAAFPLLAPDGTVTGPSYSFADGSGFGFYFQDSIDVVSFAYAGENRVSFRSTNTSLTLQADQRIGWTASVTDSSASADTDLARAAANVVTTTNATGGAGWIQNASGDQFLTANHTNATTTPTDLTDLTTSVTSGRKYTFTFIAKVDNSTDTDGLRFDFEGGTAAATDFWANCAVEANNVVSSTFAVTALATDMTAATLTGVGTFRCNGSFEPSSTGTFIPRAGTNTAVSGTLTTFRGSHLLSKDMP